VSSSGGLVLRVPDWRHNYPAWTRDIDSTAIVETVHGFKLRCDAYDYVGRHIIIDRNWEPLIAKTIASIARRGCLCLDIGANIGFHSLVMAQSVGPSGRVISFEPDLRNFTFLVENLEMNRMSHVLPINMGLSDSSLILNMAPRFGANYGAANMRGLMGENEGQLALVMRGELLPLLNGYGSIELVKLDVEGFEVRVLHGIAGLLSRIRHIICEVNPQWIDTDALFSLLAQAGFRYLTAPPSHVGKWCRPEHRQIKGQHDALFYREMTDALASIVE
jgi:FkbM family methyltransferase